MAGREARSRPAARRPAARRRSGSSPGRARTLEFDCNCLRTSRSTTSFNTAASTTPTATRQSPAASAMARPTAVPTTRLPSCIGSHRTGSSQSRQPVDGVEHALLPSGMLGLRRGGDRGRQDGEPGARDDQPADGSRPHAGARRCRRSSSRPGSLLSAVRVAPLNAHGCSRSPANGERRRDRPSARRARSHAPDRPRRWRRRRARRRRWRAGGRRRRAR